jgi:hypothetical protein
MGKVFVQAVALLAFATSTSAMAADFAVKAPPPVSEDGFYAWLDGSYQQISLPRYSLGFNRNPDTGGPTDFFDLGKFDSINARVDGPGGTGGIGFMLPNTALSPLFGTNLRVEAIVSGVSARSTQIGGTSLADPNQESAIQLMNGQTISTIQNCGTCTTSTTLNTKYTSVQGGGRIATDYRSGYFSWTPSLGFFAGNTRTEQTFAQSLLSIPPAPSPSFNSTYNASTSLRWTDIGLRFGSEGRLQVHPWVALALGGSLGVAERRTNFSGSDIVSCGFVCTPNSSTIGASGTRTALLANAEGSITVGQPGGWKARIFAGLNWDDSVPGISPSSYGGPIFTPTSVTPAGIFYSRQTSLYAGGGLSYKFFGATQ